MLDIQFIKDNPELVSQKSKAKGYVVDVVKLLKIDEERRSLNVQVDELRHKRKLNSENITNKKPTEFEINDGKKIKKELAELEDKLNKVDIEYLTELKKIPNMPLDDVVYGQSEDENVVVKVVGEKPVFDFKPKAHQELGEFIDKERAAKIAGSRFAYLKGDLVKLQFAIVSFVIATLTDEIVISKLIKDNKLNIATKVFMPIIPPAMIKTEPYQASARLNAEEVTYKIEQDDLWLNASAEHSLCTMYMDEIIEEAQLPLRFVGYSTSFRREAGTYGKDMEGIIRLHQFDKLEMEVLSTGETGLDEHKLLVAIQEYLVSKLGLPYQLLDKCTADIGKPNAKGVDINSWFPSQDTYRETHTADYLTDYQARGLKMRTRRSSGAIEYVHTNDATAFALGRIMAAILENNQTNDGKINIPEVLINYMGGIKQI